MTGKACTRCGKVYANPEEGFHRRPVGGRSAAGFVGRCKVCIRETAKPAPTVERACMECGRAFAASIYHVRSGQKRGRPSGIYCSTECRHASRRVPGSHCTLTCARCARPFVAWANRVIPRKYCSHECAGVRAEAVQKECEVCHASYRVIPSHAANSKCCSRRCHGLRTKILRAWSTPEERARLGSTDWKRLRRRVLERDEHKCRACGTSNRRLHVHHVIPWRDSRDDSMDNLLTLCISCHPIAEAARKPRRKRSACVEVAH